MNKKMFRIIETTELKVPPLTEEELKWIYSFKRCLAKCPKRLEFLTYGDQLMVVDSIGAHNSELHSGYAYEDGILLAYMNGPKCHGCV